MISNSPCASRATTTLLFAVVYILIIFIVLHLNILFNTTSDRFVLFAKNAPFSLNVHTTCSREPELTKKKKKVNNHVHYTDNLQLELRVLSSLLSQRKPASVEPAS